jgi:serine/threonine-protein kinase
MAIVSSGGLFDTLRRHGLLTAERLMELLNIAQGRCGDARVLARLLVQRGWLTVYQMNQILTDNAENLVFGSYHVLDCLGEGGLASVYKARNTQYDLLFALKVLRPGVLTHQEGRQQFLLEVEAMASLDHPNVVQFCDADQAGETCYFAMEFVEGTDLGKVVRLAGALPVREACDYIHQTALGLQHAHEHNLVHRDIKPVNLFLTHLGAARPASVYRHGAPAKTSKGRPLIKILDWGLVCVRDPRGTGPGQLAENVGGCIIGTADYLSPEQARNADIVDIRGDIYSLGCTFYYLLTGQAPFPNGSLMQKIMQHQQAEPKPVETFRDDLPVGVTAILKRMMAKKPEDRFQTPAALALALLPFARGEDGKGSSPALPLLKGTPPLQRRDHTPLPIALGGKLGQSIGRMPKAGLQRGGSPLDDTSCPQKR